MRKLLQFYRYNPPSILQVNQLSLPLVVVPALYLFFQVFRFVTLVMYAAFMVQCDVYRNGTVADDCKINSTLLYITPRCGSYCWKGMWVGCSVGTCFIWLLVFCVPAASKHIREIRPASNTSIIRSLAFKPYFWYLNFIVILVVVYDAIILFQKNVSGSEEGQVGVILSNLLTAALVFQLNFTYPPSASRFPLHFIASYYTTLSLFFMDYLYKFVELSIRTVYKLYALHATQPDETMQVFSLMMEVVNVSLCYYFATFFWNKIFRGRRDVLMTYSPDLAHSLSVKYDQA